jgi:hypothetical protein
MGHSLVDQARDADFYLEDDQSETEDPALQGSREMEGAMKHSLDHPPREPGNLRNGKDSVNAFRSS